MKIAKNFSELIGNTPMLELCRIEKDENLCAKIFAKLEGLNPGGSIKDRVACSMIDEAEKSGMLKPNSLIIEQAEPCSGVIKSKTPHFLKFSIAILCRFS